MSHFGGGDPAGARPSNGRSEPARFHQPASSCCSTESTTSCTAKDCELTIIGVSVANQSWTVAPADITVL